MKATLVLLAALFVLCYSRPQQNPQQAYIIRYDNDNAGFGKYSFNVETSDGFSHNQLGYLRNEGAEDEILVVRGSYSYVGPDGVTYTVNYIADENGFHPNGLHLPPSADVSKFGTPSVAPVQASYQPVPVPVIVPPNVHPISLPSVPVKPAISPAAAESLGGGRSG